MEARRLSQSQNGEQLNQGSVENVVRTSPLPSFVDGKDNLDEYLLRFERYASVASSSSFGRVPHFQMLAVMVLSQHRVSTSKTVSPRIPVGARCTGHVRMMCSAVCSAAPHSQFDVGARPHLCMND